MGAWGVQVFENDDALDWVDRLHNARDHSLLARTFASVPGDTTQSLRVRNACCALAAAEVVAALLSEGASPLPEVVAEWVQAHRAITPELVEEARRSVRRILANSELGGLWEESGRHEEWKSAVQGLLTRLSAKSARKVPPGRSEPRARPRTRGRGLKRRHQRPRTDQARRSGPAEAEDNLRDRATRFLQGIVPFEGYTSETQVEDHIRRYIAGGPQDEPGMHDELRLCYSVVLREIDSEDYAAYPEAQRAYLQGCAEMLREIMMELYGEAESYEDIG